MQRLKSIKIKVIAIIIVIVSVILLIINSFVIIDGGVVSKFSTEIRIHNCSSVDVDKLNKSWFPFLKSLSIVYLDDNDISFLNNMPSLNELSINTGHTVNWNIVSRCKKLKRFSGAGMEFDDLSCFSSLEQLEELNISRHYSPVTIDSTSGLENMINLNSLNLRGVKSEFIKELVYLIKLKTLHIGYSDIIELDIDFSKLHDLYLSNNFELKKCAFSINCVDLEKITILDCPNIMINIDELLALPRLKEISASKDIFSDEEIEKLKSNGIEVNLHE